MDKYIYCLPISETSGTVWDLPKRVFRILRSKTPRITLREGSRIDKVEHNQRRKKRSETHTLHLPVKKHEKLASVKDRC